MGAADAADPRLIHVPCHCLNALDLGRTECAARREGGSTLRRSEEVYGLLTELTSGDKPDLCSILVSSVTEQGPGRGGRRMGVAKGPYPFAKKWAAARMYSELKLSYERFFFLREERVFVFNERLEL